MKNKAVTNVEMIVAATIFIFSVVLATYYITFVYLGDSSLEIFLSILEKNLRNEVEVSYNLSYLNISYVGSENCFNISLISSIAKEEKNVTIKDGNGNDVPFNISDGYLLIHSEGFFAVYSFPIHVNSRRLETCSPIALTKEFYNYSLAYQEKIFSYEKLSKLKYDEFKAKYNFQKDFLINLDDITIGTAKPLQVVVKAKQVPVKYINESEGKIKEALLNMQVW